MYLLARLRQTHTQVNNFPLLSGVLFEFSHKLELCVQFTQLALVLPNSGRN